EQRLEPRRVGLPLLEDGRPPEQGVRPERAAGQDEPLLGVEAAEVGFLDELALLELGPAQELGLPEPDPPLEAGPLDQEAPPAPDVIATERPPDGHPSELGLDQRGRRQDQPLLVDRFPGELRAVERAML